MAIMRTFNTEADPTGMLVSEKFDGVQARWNGRQLTTRNGNGIDCPSWFTERLPGARLIGELSLGRNKFQETVSAVRGSRNDQWRRIRFIVFDPIKIDVDLGRYAEKVQQTRIRGREHLRHELNRVVALGGEGLVLRSGKFNTCLKLKPTADADGIVVDHAGPSIVVRLPDGMRLKINTKKQPALGSLVVFEYDGFTNKGLPRFPRLKGIRAEVA